MPDLEYSSELFDRALKNFIIKKLEIQEPSIIDAIYDEIKGNVMSCCVRKINNKKFGLYDTNTLKCIGIYDSEDNVMARMERDIFMQLTADLEFCPKCQGETTAIKVWTDKDGKRRRLKYCIRPGCGYKQEFPFPDDYITHSKK